MALNYLKPERIWMKSHPELNEKWVQDRIADDPSLLGLGELILRDRERMQPGAGRLDLLLQEVDSSRRYEVELQLGKTDETHIIRTIEYWDIERKRYPQYEHTAVLIAEDITSRFLNVVGLFNGFIPLVALQMQAYKFGEHISLIFTTVLDQMPLGLVDEDEEVAEVVDRSYWEKRASKSTLELADKLFDYLKRLDADLSQKYNKFYIGIAKGGRPNNFVVFQPKKEWLWLGLRIERSEEFMHKFEEAGFEGMEYDSKRGKYWVRLTKADLPKNETILKEFLERAYHEANG